MSRLLISRSKDLSQLEDDGYRINIRSGHLVVDHIPYVASDGSVKYGKLVSTLKLAGNETDKPDTHVAMFSGGFPCDRHGKPLANIHHSNSRRDLGDGLIVDHSFSSKPPNGYSDYHHKMTTYASIISSHAEAVDPTVTARPYGVIEGTDDSVFKIYDSASGRIGVSGLNEKLSNQRIAIIGLGGTGSYVLDFVAKTPVQKIHLIDADTYAQHNAFRCPGSPTLATLRKKPTKVSYLSRIYSRMHRHIIPHEVLFDDVSDELLQDLTFAFICIDDASVKKRIVERLERHGISFIDVGMGVTNDPDGLRGIVRTTISTVDKRDHVHELNRIPMGAEKVDDAYSTNIQIAELNALNAALAVIRWKKHLGFYADLEREHNSCYTIDGNVITNDDQAV